MQNNTVGVYGQQQFGFRDRLFLTAGVRSDNNSSFGSNFKRVTYPKVSASWVVSEEPFFSRVPFVNTLKLRSAYGQTGQAPLPYSAVPFFGGHWTQWIRGGYAGFAWKSGSWSGAWL